MPHHAPDSRYTWLRLLITLALMTIGGAVTFFLWIWALEHTTPSRVAITVTMNPVAAVILGSLVLSEPVTWRLLVGLAAIIAGITAANWNALRSGLRRR